MSSTLQGKTMHEYAIGKRKNKEEYPVTVTQSYTGMYLRGSEQTEKTLRFHLENKPSAKRGKRERNQVRC